ncbi:PAS domain S-box protein [Natrinema sp. SYSU A 869]|uniref:PAS domain S-box protein n=1 Tax=Natrinema sp. SYSU A 869 TaxID=2871694 RepID=UPI001CA45441|nr:PAS domain S-box protein [Natrinema sp. SYSU A 869]
MSSGIHVLCVDDDSQLLELTATVLERYNDNIVVTTAGSGRDGLAMFDGESDVDTDTEPDHGIDCVVSDYDMPDMDGLELFAAVRERDSAVPFILFTGKGSEEIAGEAISAGVTDYLQKGSGTDQYTVLANRIENAVEKHRADRARRESERELERYRALVETVTDPMCVLDDEGRCTIANEAFCDLLDTDRDRVVGEHITEFISRESFERGVETVRGLYTGDRESGYFECTVETDTGEERIYEANVAALTDETGAFAGSTAVIRDSTSRTRRKHELTQYERIIELAPTALFVLDADGTITWCNDVFVDAFAEDKAQLIGTAFSELVERGYYDEQMTTTYANEVRELLSSTVDREQAKYQVQFHAADGEERIHDVHTRLLPLEDGAFTGTIHATRDITRRCQYRRELERQNERLEEFASLVSHDLRNPLNVGQGHLDSLDEQYDSQHVDELQWSLSRMAELVDGLLQLARQGKSIGEQARFPLENAAERAWSTVDTGQARLEINTDIEIYGDEGRVRELLENLFRNAVEHGSTSPRSDTHEDAVEHGSTSPNSQTQRETVEQSTNRDEHDGTDPLVVTVGSLEGGRQAAGTDASSNGFYVEDTGRGLSADRDSLFEFGYTTETDGTGFGLAIVEEIVTAHGWSISARNGSAGGARFEISDIRTTDADIEAGPDESDLETNGPG